MVLRMNVSSRPHGLALLLACSTTLVLPACEGPSQLVVGVVTNLRARDQVARVALEAYRNDVLVDQKSWRVSDQTGTTFVLPGSFNYYSEQGGTPVIRLVLTGFDDESSIIPVVTRETEVRLSAAEDLFYRMSLVLACREGEPNGNCPEGLSCVEGICKPISIDPRTLLPYEPDRVEQIECDSGSRYIDTGTCSSGTCALLPITGPNCPGDQFCSEGTCYQRNPAEARRLEFGEICDGGLGDLCRETSYTCSAAPNNFDKQRCRQLCQTPADCTRRLPDAIADGIPAGVADCTAVGGGPKVCTYACDPVNAANSGCLSGTRCSVTTDTSQFIATDCVPATSNGGTVPLDGACNAGNGNDDCAPGASCVQRAGDPTPTCRKNCFVDSPMCPGSSTCVAVRTAASFASTRYGVCLPPLP